MTGKFKLAITLGLASVLSACVEPPVAPTVVPPPRGNLYCSADPVQGYVGRLFSSFVLDEIRINSNSQSARALTPDMAATTDFRPDRVTVNLDTSNRVTKISCG